MDDKTKWYENVHMLMKISHYMPFNLTKILSFMAIKKKNCDTL